MDRGLLETRAAADSSPAPHRTPGQSGIQGGGLTELAGLDLANLSLLPQPRKGGRCSTCSVVLIACACIALGVLLGGGFVFLVMRSLNQQPDTPLPQCPGVCLGRSLVGHFAGNVSRSIGGWGQMKFTISHRFFKNGSVSVVMQSIESPTPFWERHGYACYTVPASLADACNVSLSDACTQNAGAVNQVGAPCPVALAGCRSTIWAGGHDSSR